MSGESDTPVFKTKKRRANSKKRGASALSNIKAEEPTSSVASTTDTSTKEGEMGQYKKAKLNPVGGMSHSAAKSSSTIDVYGLNSYKSDTSGKMDTTAQDNVAVTIDRTGHVKTDANKVNKMQGPMKMANNVKMNSMYDYNPSICKDYKDTGFCSYGDTCIYLHDRGNYKSGWQLEKEWQEEQERKRMIADGLIDPDENDQAEKKPEDELPFACYICKNDFKNPVVTKCKHYFCESCALKRFQKSKKCAICNVNTSGVFNTATIILQNKDKLAVAKAKAQASFKEAEKQGITAQKALSWKESKALSVKK